MCGEGAWAVSGAVSRVAREDPASDPTPDLRVWEHVDYKIAKP